jgi:hypothetical protein
MGFARFTFDRVFVAERGFALVAKTLSLAQVFRMSDAEAESMFCRVRWFDTDGKPVCPN